MRRGGLDGALRDGNFTDPHYGMVGLYATTGAHPSCDNYWLFTAQARELGYWLDRADVVRFFEDCCASEFGLISRWPGLLTDISKDELIGAAALSSSFAIAIADYADRTFWSFDLQRPGKFSLGYWIGRYPDVAPFIHARANRTLRWSEKLSWSIGCVLSCLSGYDSTDGKLLMLLQMPHMRGKYWLCDGAIRLWNWRMRKLYPRGPKELRERFFPPGNPLPQYSPTAF